ncbi:MAG: ORF6N domain-containing protein [Candidatus Margulisiibacteriota bacterium]
MTNNNDIQTPIETIATKILVVRGQKVMLDRDLAKLYGVQTKRLKEQVKRNIERFPDDFMLELTYEEFQNLRSHCETSSWGGERYSPYAFTEQGVAMLSSVISSKTAIRINIQIMRAFVKIRQILATNEDVKRKLKEHDFKIDMLFNTVDQLLTTPEVTSKKYGFNTEQ